MMKIRTLTCRFGSPVRAACFSDAHYFRYRFRDRTFTNHNPLSNKHRNIRSIHFNYTFAFFKKLYQAFYIGFKEGL